jgi:hypothetical protein
MENGASRPTTLLLITVKSNKRLLAHTRAYIITHTYVAVVWLGSVAQSTALAFTHAHVLLVLFAFSFALFALALL